MIPVTVIITTRDEEKNIRKCLESIYGFVDQILVIDSESTDRTLEIASEYTESTYSLPYEHERIIPWIYQWGLDNLPIRNEWVLLLEADQVLTKELKSEMQSLFARGHIRESGFYVRRQQVFRGRIISHGGYGTKYLLRLFQRSAGELDAREQDTRVYVNGEVVKLKAPLIEENLKEADIIFYLQKHLRYATAFAAEEFERKKQGLDFKQKPSLFGHQDRRVLWMKNVYYRMPLYVRPFLYLPLCYSARVLRRQGRVHLSFPSSLLVQADC